MRIREVSWIIGLGGTNLYEALKSRALMARRYCRRRMVLAEELVALLPGMPTTR